MRRPPYDPRPLSSSRTAQGPIPCMPIQSSTKREAKHREKVPKTSMPFTALVARILNKKEITASPEAKAALKKEWDKLREQGVLDVKGVQPWSKVAAEARDNKKTVHVGRIFEICGEELRITFDR